MKTNEKNSELSENELKQVLGGGSNPFAPDFGSADPEIGRSESTPFILDN